VYPFTDWKDLLNVLTLDAIYIFFKVEPLKLNYILITSISDGIQIDTITILKGLIALGSRTLKGPLQTLINTRFSDGKIFEAILPGTRVFRIISKNSLIKLPAEH
jgi:hypothetical protein